MLPESSSKSNLFWAVTVNHCYTTTVNPIEGDWQKKRSANFLPWDLWAFWGGQDKTWATADTSLWPCITPWLLSALTEASWTKPRRKPQLHTVWRPGERCVNKWVGLWGICSCHLGKQNIWARTGYSLLRKEQTMKIWKIVDLTNLDHWKTQEAVTPVVLN